MPRDILLIVGNGLTIDAIENTSLREKYNTDKIFSWDIECPNPDTKDQFFSKKYLEKLFEFANTLESIKGSINEKFRFSDFNIIEALLQDTDGTIDKIDEKCLYSNNKNFHDFLNFIGSNLGSILSEINIAQTRLCSLKLEIEHLRFKSNILKCEILNSICFPDTDWHPNLPIDKFNLQNQEQQSLIILYLWFMREMSSHLSLIWENDSDNINLFLEAVKKRFEEFFLNLNFNNDICSGVRNILYVKTELQHYINYAFVKFQNEFDNIFYSRKRKLSLFHKLFGAKKIKSSLSKFLAENYDRIALIISLNYELVLERILQRFDQKYYRIGTEEHEEGIPIWKPHGSIDFNTPLDGFIKTGKPIYPLNSFLSRNEILDRKTNILNKKDWTMLRSQIDIVLPTQTTHLKEFGFNRDGEKYFRQIKSSIKDCILFGISYMSCDRLEIDEFINHDSIIIIVNPSPSGTLTSKLWLAKRNVQIYEKLINL